MRRLDLTCNRYGRLLVLAEGKRRRRPNGIAFHRFWLCECDCGNQITVEQQALRSGNTQSCGCLRIEHPSTLTHGHSRRGRQSATYYSWAAMVARCSRPTASNYSYYGARGIKVCERWLVFTNFLEDMGERPEGHTLDRIDVNGDYELENCRWATATAQARNRRRPKSEFLV
jgi:hypothetical protein